MNNIIKDTSTIFDNIKYSNIDIEKEHWETVQRIPTSLSFVSNSGVSIWNYRNPIESIGSFTIKDFTPSTCLLVDSELEYIQINELITKKLKSPLLVTLEPDDEGYIAQSKEFPLYGYGDDKNEAIDNLKFELESLYFDLLKDDNFTQEWLEYKKILKGKIIN